MTIRVDGGRLRGLLEERGMRQLDLAKNIGVNRFNVNRWCKRGHVASVKNGNVEKLAKALGMSIDDFLKACGAERRTTEEADMTAAEMDWLTLYRNLSPLNQAKVRVAVDDIVKKLDSSDRHHGA